MSCKFLGTGVALVTPFKSDLSIDHDALANIVNFNVNNGTDYLVVCGTTGESVTITKQEKKELIATISKANKGRIPMVLGIGGNNTAQVVEEIKDKPAGTLRWQGPLIKVTFAPLSRAAQATAYPIFPDDGLVIKRTGSNDSWVGPAVTRTLSP